MIISRTPYRISFFGGGTDYPNWYLKNTGQVLSTSIDKYLYISCRYLPPFFEHNLRFVYSKIEFGNHPDDLKHPAVRAILKYLKIYKNLEIHYDGDLPARSGIGSSSAFTVGLLNAIYNYKNIKKTKKNLAKDSIFIEQKMIKEIVGSQDQISAAYGGINNIKFLKNGNFTVNPIKISKKKFQYLQNHLMLFHTGIFRTAESVSKKYINNLDKKSYYLDNLNLMVSEAINILRGNNINEFGNLLNESWLLKKGINNHISNSFIDNIYSTAMKNGALGGKLLGAGGGGFFLLYVPKNKQKKLKKIFKKLLYIPFNFENNGSQIIYNQPQKTYKTSTNEGFRKIKK